MTKHIKRFCILAGALLGLAGTSVAASACSVPYITTFDNQPVRGTMAVRSGKPCTIRFRSSSGPMYGVKVVQAPGNGTVRVDGLGSVTYQSRAGYTGRDAFTYARHGETRGGAPSLRTVRVAVNVRP